MNIRKWHLVPMLVAAALLSGCSNRPVRCDDKLTPINVPAQVQKEKTS